VPGGEPIVITNTGTTKNPTLDFGVWASAGLGNYVWIDQNQNGRQNAGETPVTNFGVTLYNSARQAISNTRTNLNGNYIFTGLLAGSYYVCFAQPTSPYTFTLWMSDTNGMGSDQDSNADIRDGYCSLAVTLRPGEYNPTLDAGIYQPTAVTLSDFRVTANGDKLRVMWRTTSEIDAFGFAVYRSQTSNRNDAVLITSELISAKGSGSYFVDDATADIGKHYTYWLQEIERSGAINEYPPTTYAPQQSVPAVVSANLAPAAGGVPVDGGAGPVTAPQIATKPLAVAAEAKPQNVSAVKQSAVQAASPINTNNSVPSAVEVNPAEVSAQPQAQSVVASSASAATEGSQENRASEAVVSQPQAPSAERPVNEPNNIHQTQARSRPSEQLVPTPSWPNLTTRLMVITLSLIALGVLGAVLGLALWVGRRRE
jgi:hypothetical protein